MEPENAFCLFDCDLGQMAVSVESVVAVLDMESLVRLVWSPPQVVGLCPYHREVVPVITIGPTGSDRSTEPETAIDPRPEVAAEASAAKVVGAEKTGCVVLILRTEHDAWGLRIDHSGTSISRERPDFHAPRLDENGSVWIGHLLRAKRATRFSTLRRPGADCGRRLPAGMDSRTNPASILRSRWAKRPGKQPARAR